MKLQIFLLCIFFVGSCQAADWDLTWYNGAPLSVCLVGKLEVTGDDLTPCYCNQEGETVSCKEVCLLLCAASQELYEDFQQRDCAGKEELMGGMVKEIQSMHPCPDEVGSFLPSLFFLHYELIQAYWDLIKKYPIKVKGPIKKYPIKVKGPIKKYPIKVKGPDCRLVHQRWEDIWREAAGVTKARQPVVPEQTVLSGAGGPRRTEDHS